MKVTNIWLRLMPRRNQRLRFARAFLVVMGPAGLLNVVLSR